MENEALKIVAVLCKHFEGFRAAPYMCPAGVATIGYGTTAYDDGTRVTMHDKPVTEHEAEILLIGQIKRQYLPAVLLLCHKIDTAKRLAAILDFTYNLGSNNLKNSTLRRRVNDGDWDGAKVELAKWVKGGGKTLPGLVRRRNAEIALID